VGARGIEEEEEEEEEEEKNQVCFYRCFWGTCATILGEIMITFQKKIILNWTRITAFWL
jgi:hypothetical protein